MIAFVVVIIVVRFSAVLQLFGIDTAVVVVAVTVTVRSIDFFWGGEETHSLNIV